MNWGPSEKPTSAIPASKYTPAKKKKHPPKPKSKSDKFIQVSKFLISPSTASTSQLIARDLELRIVQSVMYDHELTCQRLMYWEWSEMDVFAMRKSGYVTEFEIKISKSDFQSDFYKTVSWGGEGLKHDSLRAGNCFPNRFYFVMPATIQDIKLPSYAGLIVATRDNKGRVELQTLRNAPLLHKEKHLTVEHKYQIARKYVYRYHRAAQKLHNK